MSAAKTGKRGRGKKSSSGLALVTGASAGIGLALAQRFAAGGHDLLLVSRSGGKLADIAAEISQQHGVNCDWIAADLQRPEAPEAIFEEAARRGFEVDILINNAGVLWEGAFAEIPLEKQLGLLQLNIAAATELMHRFLPPMQQRKRGRILNVCSTSSFNPVPSLATYAASKAYLLSLSEALSLELRGSGVTVTALCPGFTETAMIAQDGRKPMSLPLVPNMTPEQVADEAFDACMAGQAVRINGLMNRLAVESTRRSPLWLRREMIALMEKWGV
jgi:short-subunit dehydrogenase